MYPYEVAIDEFVEELRRPRSAMTAADPSADCPYVGLQPFEERHRDYFFGRERDQRIIIANLLSSPLTVVYGSSGVGKSSVLMAGVVPQLRRDRPRTPVVVFRKWVGGDFQSELTQACIQAVWHDGMQQPRPADTLAARRGAARVRRGGARARCWSCSISSRSTSCTIPSRRDPESFEAQFARAVNREDVDIGVLVALREDSLSKLDRFQERIPNLLSNRLRLTHLDKAGATSAIRRPLEVWNARHADQAAVSVEDGLVARLLDEVRIGRVAVGRQGGSGTPRAEEELIEAPFLQLVLTRLWKEEAVLGSRTLRLATLERLRRAKEIVRSHLEHVMATLDPTQQAVCASFFDRLVTPTGSKVACSTESLEGYAGALAPRVRAVLGSVPSGRAYPAAVAVTGDSSGPPSYEDLPRRPRAGDPGLAPALRGGRGAHARRPRGARAGGAAGAAPVGRRAGGDDGGGHRGLAQGLLGETAGGSESEGGGIDRDVAVSMPGSGSISRSRRRTRPPGCGSRPPRRPRTHSGRRFRRRGWSGASPSRAPSPESRSAPTAASSPPRPGTGESHLGHRRRPPAARGCAVFPAPGLGARRRLPARRRPHGDRRGRYRAGVERADPAAAPLELVQGSPIYSAFAVSRDGGRLATAGSGTGQRVVKVWDLAAASTEPVATIDVDGAWVMGLAFSPDGCCLATARRSSGHGSPATPRCGIATGKRIWTCRIPAQRRGGVHPRRAAIVTAGRDNRVRVWRPAVGRYRLMAKQIRERPTNRRPDPGRCPGTNGCWRAT